MTDIPQKLGLVQEAYKRMIDNLDFNIRCAMPGIIQSFDSSDMTVEVLIAVSERILCNADGFIQEHNSNMASIPIPILGKVPIVLPTAGGYSITLPIQEGDECLVVFADTCIDGWWEWGCENSTTGEIEAQECVYSRRHDLSDGIAILGTWSKPRALELLNYSEDSMQIRSDDGLVIIELKKQDEEDPANKPELNIYMPNETDVTKDVEITLVDGELTIKTGASTSIVVKNGEVTVSATEINLGASAGLRALIDERFVSLFNNHTHPVPVANSVSAAPPTAVCGVPSVQLTSTDCQTMQAKAL